MLIFVTESDHDTGSMQTFSMTNEKSTHKPRVRPIQYFVVRRHDDEMRALSTLAPDDRATEFDRLRREYPPRRDFHAWTIRCQDSEMAQLLDRLGFSVPQQSD